MILGPELDDSFYLMWIHFVFNPNKTQGWGLDLPPPPLKENLKLVDFTNSANQSLNYPTYTLQSFYDQF